MHLCKFTISFKISIRTVASQHLINSAKNENQAKIKCTPAFDVLVTVNEIFYKKKSTIRRCKILYCVPASINLTGVQGN